MEWLNRENIFQISKCSLYKHFNMNVYETLSGIELLVLLNKEAVRTLTFSPYWY